MMMMVVNGDDGHDYVENDADDKDDLVTVFTGK